MYLLWFLVPPHLTPTIHKPWFSLSPKSFTDSHPLRMRSPFIPSVWVCVCVFSDRQSSSHSILLPISHHTCDLCWCLCLLCVLVCVLMYPTPPKHLHAYVSDICMLYMVHQKYSPMCHIDECAHMPKKLPLGRTLDTTITSSHETRHTHTHIPFDQFDTVCVCVCSRNHARTQFRR